MPKAPAPSRSSFKLTVTLGLVSFQFAAFKLTEERKVTRKMFSPEGNSIGNQTIDTVTGELVNRADVVMKYETEDGVLVPLNDAEIVKAAGYDELTGTEVVGVVSEKYLRSRFFSEEVYAIRPADKHQTKVMKLILESLAMSAEAILIRFVVRGRERLAMLNSNGTMRVFLFEDEIREEPKPPATDPALSDQERELAGKLLETFRVSADSLNEQITSVPGKVEKYAVAKAAGMPKDESQTVSSVPLGDLMAMLTASVEKAKAGVS